MKSLPLILADSQSVETVNTETLNAGTVNTQPAVNDAGGMLAQIKKSFAEMGADLISLLPKVTIALLLFILGLLVAKLIRSFLTKTFKTINLDKLLDKAGIGGIFAKMGISSGASVFIPKLIYYFILLVVVRVAADSAGIEDVTKIINEIIAFLPAALTAGIIMLVGFLVADLIQGAVFRLLDAMGLEYANTLSKVLSGFVFILALTVALPQLGIETELLNDSVKIILGGIALAIALALGLGLKTPPTTSSPASTPAISTKSAPPSTTTAPWPKSSASAPLPPSSRPKTAPSSSSRTPSLSPSPSKAAPPSKRNASFSSPQNQPLPLNPSKPPARARVPRCCVR